MRNFILLSLCLCAFIYSKGQVVPFEDIDLYTTKSGLSNNSVLSIYQDTKGFLWIGTFDGLCRYDGHELKVYRTEILNADGSWILSIDAIQEDHKNNIWIGTRSGVGVYNKKTRQWQFNDNEDLHSIRCFYEGDNGNMWYGTITGRVGLLSGDSLKKQTRVKLPGNIQSISRYNNHQLVISADNIYLLDIQTNELKEAHIFPQQKGFLALQSNNKSIIMVKEDGSVMIHNIKTGQTSEIYTDNDIREFNFCKIFSSGDSVFFVVTKNTIKELSANGELINTFQSSDYITTFGNNITINHISKDNTGIMWIGTNNGLLKINNDKQLFKKYYSGQKANHIKHNYIRTLYADSNTLWLGTRYGEIGKLQFDKPGGNITRQKWYPIDSSITNTTNTIKVMKDKTVWAGCETGVYYLKPNSKKFMRFTDKKNVWVNLVEVWDITEDNAGMLWAGTRKDGFFIINPKNNTIIHYPIVSQDKEYTTAIWNIYKDKRDRMWLGTSKGLFLTDRNQQGELSFNKNYTTGNIGIKGKQVWSIRELDGNLWVGTTDKGLSKLNLSNGSVQNYDISDGLPGNMISSIVTDKAKNIWVSTLNGISRLHPNTNMFVNYNEEDGLISNDYNFKAAAVAYNGIIFFGTKIGMTSFDPQKIPAVTSNNAQVVLSSVTVSGKEYGDFTGDTGSISLSYKENNASLRFAITDFKKPRSHVYHFTLSGFEEDWHTANSENPTAVYTNLPPGEYKFKLSASVDGNNKLEQTTMLHIYIKPALWQTLWFKLSVVFVSLSLVGFIIYYRFNFVINRERLQHKTDKKVAELEMTALRAQMNPHFIFNAISSIQHFIISNDVVTANEYLAKFGKLIRLFLESSRNKYISLKDETHLITLYIELEKLRFEDKFEYIIHLDTNLNEHQMQIPSMIIQPVVENAIIHGLVHLEHTKGILEITFCEKNGLLECIIEDNGVGRKKAQELNVNKKGKHPSVATDIINERIEAYKYLNKDITLNIKDKTDEHQLPAGTKVVIVLPLVKNTTYD